VGVYVLQCNGPGGGSKKPLMVGERVGGVPPTKNRIRAVQMRSGGGGSWIIEGRDGNVAGRRTKPNGVAKAPALCSKAEKEESGSWEGGKGTGQRPCP